MNLWERFIRFAVSSANGCWTWIGYRNRKGYGRFYNPSGSPLAHRIAYELLRGPIPPGRQIDHLCKNRACVNPAHMEAVTLRQNVQRSNAGLPQSERAECPQGHEYTAANTYVDRRGSRSCRECKRADFRRRYAAGKVKK